MRALAALLFLAAAAPAAAQVEVGTGLGPESFLHGERGPSESMPILPLALATSLAFDATTWAQVQVSTVPAQDLTQLLRRGYYKLELLQAVLLASRAKVPLKEISTAHDKGKSMRELAKEKQLDFEALYEEALKLDRDVVERHLPSIMAVRVEKGEVASPPAKNRNREKKP